MPQGIDHALRSRCLVHIIRGSWALPVLLAYGSWCKTVAESGIISSRTVWADVPDAFRTIVRRLEIFRRFAVSTAEIYFIMYTASLFILYSQDGIMSSIFRWEHTKIRTDRLFKKDIIINRCVSCLFSEVPINALTAIPIRGETKKQEKRQLFFWELSLFAVFVWKNFKLSPGGLFSATLPYPEAFPSASAGYSRDRFRMLFWKIWRCFGAHEPHME